MQQAQFIRLVQRTERSARMNPGGYRFAVALLGLLGYLYILLMLVFAGALVGGIVYLIVSLHSFSIMEGRIIVPLVLFAGVVVRSLFVVIPEPTGRQIDRHEAPPLFIAIDRLRSQMRLPRFDKVLLTSEFNASIAQVPRLGIFGWHRNILTIGLPLLQALPPDCVRAILAHEMGHVSGAHGKLGAWVYRVSETWDQLFEAFAGTRHRGATLFGRFFRWYAPYFFAYSLALRKAHEFEADRSAAQTVGAKLMAESLMRTEMVAILCSYGPERRPSQEEANKMLQAALNYISGPGESHPSLIERLRNIRQEPFIPDPPTQSAAEAFLAHRHEQLARQMQVL